jgi:hypothetical protein
VLRLSLALLAMTIGVACQAPERIVQGIIVPQHDVRPATFLPSDGSGPVDIKLGRRMTDVSCVEVGLRERDVAKGRRPVRAGLVRAIPYEGNEDQSLCKVSGLQTVMGSLSCTLEKCTFSSPDWEGVYAQPILTRDMVRRLADLAGVTPHRPLWSSWPYCVRLQGWLGPEGQYGHLGGNNHVLYVVRVEAARNVPAPSWCDCDVIERAPSASARLRPAEPFCVAR